jgi:hypothetical protein
MFTYLPSQISHKQQTQYSNTLSCNYFIMNRLIYWLILVDLECYSDKTAQSTPLGRHCALFGFEIVEISVLVHI